MSDPENFLSRWARRKRDVAEADKAPNPPAHPREGGDPELHDAESDAVDSRLRGNERISDSDRNEDAPFDVASLPSVESITADTDIRAFFAPGVPAELTRAALRRAWVADPHIRDFVGLEENAWDFNNPESIPGFGKLEMTDELRREVQRIVGTLAPEPKPPALPTAVPSTQPPETAQEIASGPAPSEAPGSDPGQSIAPPPEQKPEPPQHSKELIAPPSSGAAVQNETEETENLQVVARRGHGSALPK
jgi:hypothetical protein